jgi:hypothetical protein
MGRIREPVAPLVLAHAADLEFVKGLLRVCFLNGHAEGGLSQAKQGLFCWKPWLAEDHNASNQSPPQTDAGCIPLIRVLGNVDFEGRFEGGSAAIGICRFLLGSKPPTVALRCILPARKRFCELLFFEIVLSNLT